MLTTLYFQTTCKTKDKMQKKKNLSNICGDIVHFL